MPVAKQHRAASQPEPLELGQVVITAAANAVLSPEEVLRAISRHAYGDWGDLDAEDRSANKRALVNGERIVSIYHSMKRTKFYVITEWNRMYTTVLLPEDY
ncbi:MAG: hypothetical protein PHS53_00320 [Candidatus Pacebacteria bacterium]|nr:hypothetical protein [Candidatus Paceibacterota bacterium]